MMKIVGMSAGLLLTGCATPSSHSGAAPEQVTIVQPFEYATAPSPNSFLGFKFAALARIDPSDPLADRKASQTLSLFGREDLIADISDDFRASRCAAASARDVFDEIAERAGKTSIVIINESHERSEHRGFTAEVVRRLRSFGYDTLAMEALANPFPDTPEQYLPPYMKRPGQPHLEDEDGYYLSEAAFGRLGRVARKLEYQLIGYEAHDEEGEGELPRDEQIALREERQANNLSSYLRDHPGARLIVHVGYSHAAEVPMASGARWMAARLKAKTGIDQLTISQTTCRGGGSSPRLAVLPDDQPPGIFDLVVDHPNARFEMARPVWRQQAGDRSVAIPANLSPSTGWRVIEARPAGETTASVPMDRVAIRSGEKVALLLPPGRYALRIIDVPAAPRPSAAEKGLGS